MVFFSVTDYIVMTLLMMSEYVCIMSMCLCVCTCVCLCVCLSVQELESIKRGQKQQASSQSATEVRLNQAREDIQKYKSLMQKAQADAKVIPHLSICITTSLIVTGRRQGNITPVYLYYHLSHSHRPMPRLYHTCLSVLPPVS